MDRAFINWDEDVFRLSEAGLSRHPLLAGKGAYAVLAATLDEPADLWRGLRLLYIGLSRQDGLREAVMACPAAEAIAGALRGGEEAIVMVGAMESNLGRMTTGFLDDVERCLTFRHRAACMARPVGAHEGRKISVVNRGDFAPLKPKCLLRPDA